MTFEHFDDVILPSRWSNQISLFTWFLVTLSTPIDWTSEIWISWSNLDSNSTASVMSQFLSRVATAGMLLGISVLETVISFSTVISVVWDFSYFGVKLRLQNTAAFPFVSSYSLSKLKQLFSKPSVLDLLHGWRGSYWDLLGLLSSSSNSVSFQFFQLNVLEKVGDLGFLVSL